MMNYYTVFYPSSGEVGFTPSVTSTAKITYGFPTWAIVLIVLVSIGVVGGIVFVCYKKCKKDSKAALKEQGFTQLDAEAQQPPRNVNAQKATAEQVTDKNRYQKPEGGHPLERAQNR